MTAYLPAIGVVASIVVIGSIARAVWGGATWPTVALGLLGTGLLFSGGPLPILEAWLALATTLREITHLRRLGERRVPADLWVHLLRRAPRRSAGPRRVWAGPAPD